MRRMRTIAVITILVLGVCVNSLQAVEETKPVAPPKGTAPQILGFQLEDINFSSSLLGRDYQLIVILPSEYDSSQQHYPVLYLLDGNLLFGMAANLSLLMNMIDNVPEMIIVCIAQKAKNPDEFGLLRELDYKIPEVQDAPKESRADLFLAAFKKEIIPFVETNYRSDPGKRIIWGYSSGGFFVLYALCHEPDLFRTYIAGSGDTELSSLYVPAHDQKLVSRKGNPIDLYLSVGTLETKEMQSTPAALNSLVKAINAKKYPGIRLVTETYEGESHGAGGIALTFIRGLRKTFPTVK